MEEKELDNMKSESISKSNWGGYRPGAGRKKGQLSPQTLERAAVIQAYRERVAKNANKLFNAQLNLAIGEKYLMVKRTEGTGSKRRTWTEIVEDPELIIQYLDDELENTDEEYYFMTTKPANNIAIDSLLDRTFGKPQSNVKFEGDGRNPIIAILDRYGLSINDKKPEETEQKEEVDDAREAQETEG